MSNPILLCVSVHVSKRGHRQTEFHHLVFYKTVTMDIESETHEWALQLSGGVGGHREPHHYTQQARPPL